MLLVRLHSYWSNTIFFPVVKLSWNFCFILFCLIGGLLVGFGGAFCLLFIMNVFSNISWDICNGTGNNSL